MRILQLHNRQLQRGGADIVLEREAGALESRGHEVASWFVDNREAEHLSRLQVAAKATWNNAARTSVRSLIDSCQPDVVHVHTPFPLMSPAVFSVAQSAGVPTVATVHSFRYSCVKATFLRSGNICTQCLGRRVKGPAVIHRCYHDSFAESLAVASGLTVHHIAGTFRRKVNRFITLTQFMADRLAEDGIPQNRIVVKPNFVPDSNVKVADRPRPYVLFAARLTPEKGVSTLLEAWETMPSGLDLLIAGEGPLLASCIEAAKRDPRIIVLGWVEQELVRGLLAGARALVLPSEWYEAGVPLVALEAFAVGTPVVASDVGNFTEAIEPGRNGTTFIRSDPLSLAAAIRRMTSESEKDQLRLGARKTFESSYSEAIVMDRLIEIYQAVIDEGRI